MSRASITLNVPTIPISLMGSVDKDAFSALMRGIADLNAITNRRLDELEGKTAELERRADNLTATFVLQSQYEFEIPRLNAQVDSMADTVITLTKRLEEAERMIAVLGLAVTPS